MATPNTIGKVDYTQTPHPSGVEALSLKDAPALIEKLFPVQMISVDSYKEQMAVHGKTLTSLGSYWKGRKPLILNRACVLASLLPATDDPIKDLEVFELLMGMDEVSLAKRIGLAQPRKLVECLDIADIWRYFKVTPASQQQIVPDSGPFDLNEYAYTDAKGVAKLPTISWRTDVSDTEKYALSARLNESDAYRDVAQHAKRTEEIYGEVSTHIWSRVNEHLGTRAHNFPELTEQLGVMRFGHRPTVGDTFSGSGQIPFAAAQLGCDVYAADLNPVACMLTWGAFNIVGASPERREEIESEQQRLVRNVKSEIARLGFETDGRGWRGKVYLYCLEVTCPSSGWKVPVLSTLVVSVGKKVTAELIPVPEEKRYDIALKHNVSTEELKAAEVGTYRKGNVVHYVDGVEHLNSIGSIRGDYTDVVNGKKVRKNRLRQWDVSDVVFRDNDIYNERLYAIQWIKDDGSARPRTEFRSVTDEDIDRERQVTEYVQENLAEWQSQGWVPTMRIEPGEKTDEPIRTRGWTYWHHLFNPRQIFIAHLVSKFSEETSLLALPQILNVNSRLSRWNNSGGGGGIVKGIFDNQALNTLFNYGARGTSYLYDFLAPRYKRYPLPSLEFSLSSKPASNLDETCDIYITDPPYGDAVKYEEILEVFIAWFENNPPSEFANWTWDSRRELAIKGEDHDFKSNMVAAYKRMGECMPDNGLQILMFTHQDGNIWADMANIVWASGLRVTAAWYLVTETDSALREGSYVKGTILLVLRKRVENLQSTQTDLAYEIEDEVADQVRRLTGLNDEVANSKRVKDGNLFEDADLQMAGYAAALKVLTQYAHIGGKDMTQESLRRRIPGQKLMVDELIEFAVNTANKQLVPQGLPEAVWHDRNPAERFYLKMLDLEAKGVSSLDNYQNFAKAFSVSDWQNMMASEKANKARVKNSKEFGKSELGENDQLGNTITRAVLFALMEMRSEKDVDDVVRSLQHYLPSYFSQRQAIIEVTKFIAKTRAHNDDVEAGNARILAMSIENHGT